ncbi:tripartite tricarboxylate transporter permease [bacterium]|nr:tripartite tricarboxylate transporter permease [bacterium]
MEGLSIAWHVITTTPAVFAAAFGVAWGIVGGALPGISPSISMALILPFTYGMNPVVAIILLAAVYVGAEYGGSIPAILISTPGTNAATVTVIDGYEMHRQGRGGEALGISLVTGWVGGMVGIVILIFLSGWLADVALLFSPAAYFGIGVLGLSVIASLSESSLVKGFIPGILGMMVATMGADPMSGVNRFTFDRPELITGISPIVVMVGLFAVSEMLKQCGLPPWPKGEANVKIKLPSLKMLFGRLGIPQLIGIIVGTVEGIVPGAGGTVASFISYNEARRWSRYKEEFGKGSPEGVAAPECANNVVTATTLIPVLAFGIPGSNSAAILLGGLLLHGLTPGPQLFQRNPEVVYGLFGGLVMANMFMLVIGYFTIRQCVWLVNRPKPYVLAVIYALILSGTYTLNHSLFDPMLLLIFGVIGYYMRYLGFSMLAMVLGVVLGFMVETSFRRALVMSGGDYSTFWTDPIGAVLIGFSALFVLSSLGGTLYKQLKKEKIA